MNVLLHIPTEPVSRQAELSGFLLARGVEKKALALALGVSPQAVSNMLSSDKAPAYHVEAMAEMGIPRELLPGPSKPRWPSQEGRRCQGCVHAETVRKSSTQDHGISENDVPRAATDPQSAPQPEPEPDPDHDPEPCAMAMEAAA